MNMENILSETLQHVMDGGMYSIDLESRTLKVGKKIIISNGECEGHLGLVPRPTDDALAHLNNLYTRYKYSRPSERSENTPNKYFLCLPEDEIDDEDFLYGHERYKARCELELTLLLYILNDSLHWDEFAKSHFYWHGKDDFILLAKWFG